MSDDLQKIKCNKCEWVGYVKKNNGNEGVIIRCPFCVGIIKPVFKVYGIFSGDIDRELGYKSVFVADTTCHGRSYVIPHHWPLSESDRSG